MNALVTRRSILGAAPAAIGAVSLAGIATSAIASAAESAGLSTNDARLVAIAAELEAVDRRMTVLGDAHDEVEKLPEWKDLLDRFEPLEAEVEATRADSMVGVLAKSRAALVPPIFHSYNEIGNSIAADLLRLHAQGSPA